MLGKLCKLWVLYGSKLAHSDQHRHVQEEPTQRDKLHQPLDAIPEYRSHCRIPWQKYTGSVGGIVGIVPVQVLANGDGLDADLPELEEVSYTESDLVMLGTC